MKTLIGQVKLETRLFFRRRDDLFWTLAFPVFFMLLFGAIYGNMGWEEGGMRVVDYLLPAIIVMALMTTGIMATATGFAEERGKGVYRRLSLTPLKRHDIIGGQIINRYLIILAQALILILIGTLAFKVSIVGNYLLFWGVLSLGGFCFLALGFALASVIRSAKSATPVCMIVFFVMMFLGGIFFSTSIMPEYLQRFSNILPATHLNNALRMVAVEGRGVNEVWRELLIVIGWFAGCLGLSVKFFRWE